MKKHFGIYALIWAIGLALFNVVAFVTPSELGGVSKFLASFWIAYAFITLAFFGQLLCAFFAFRAQTLQKFFYRISLVSLSYGALIAMVIVGGVFMAIPLLPAWIGAIICVLLLGGNAIAVLKANAVVDLVEEVDEKQKAETFLWKMLTADAEALVSTAGSDELRSEAKKVYEAIRYSDPISHAALTTAEAQISLKFGEFSNAVTAADPATAESLAKELCLLVEKRNITCKRLK